MDAETTQILRLHEQGMQTSEIAQALEKHPSLVEIVLKSHIKNVGKISFKEKYGELEDLIVHTYIDIMKNSENQSARARAAELLNNKMENSGINGFDYKQITEALKEVNKTLMISDEDRKLLPMEA